MALRTAASGVATPTIHSATLSRTAVGMFWHFGLICELRLRRDHSFLALTVKMSARRRVLTDMSVVYLRKYFGLAGRWRGKEAPKPNSEVTCSVCQEPRQLPPNTLGSAPSQTTVTTSQNGKYVLGAPLVGGGLTQRTLCKPV